MKVPCCRGVPQFRGLAGPAEAALQPDSRGIWSGASNHTHPPSEEASWSYVASASGQLLQEFPRLLHSGRKAVQCLSEPGPQPGGFPIALSCSRSTSTAASISPVPPARIPAAIHTRSRSERSQSAKVKPKQIQAGSRQRGPVSERHPTVVGVQSTYLLIANHEAVIIRHAPVESRRRYNRTDRGHIFALRSRFAHGICAKPACSCCHAGTICRHSGGLCTDRCRGHSL